MALVLLVQPIKDSKIRKVTEHDLLDLSILSKMFAKEAKQNGYNLSFKQDKFLNTFLKVVNNPDYYYILAEVDGETVGFFLGVVFNPMFSDDIIAAEMFWWIDKDHRGHKISIQMLNSFEDWSKKSGATQVNVSDLQSVKNLDKLYERLGYTKSEVTYRKDL